MLIPCAVLVQENRHLAALCKSLWNSQACAVEQDILFHCVSHTADPVVPQVGGLLLVAPEHRLSLLLKSYELWGAGDNTVFGQLQQIMALPYQDILDESDELLHHR